MSKVIPFIYALIVAWGAAAQAPAIQWEKTLGGNKDDLLQCTLPGADGGFVVFGTSFSDVSGSKTDPGNGSNDFWVIHLNASGTPVSQKCYGGTGNDHLYSAINTTDGGFMMVGTSDSEPSGNKTEPNYGGNDWWVVKLDGAGNIQWQKVLGGSLNDKPSRVIQTAEGGYLVAGLSGSEPSGNKTEPKQGRSDYWVVKLDALGNVEWQKSAGGSELEILESVCRTPDGGYLLAGHSESGISGDKTEANQGILDFWVVKLDATGNIQWQKTLGGNGPDYLTAVENAVDGGYLLGGWTVTVDASGDKTEAGIGGSDWWLIKLDNAGQIVWQNVMGGSKYEFLTEIRTTSDGNYLLAGYSESGVSGDKTVASKGGYDYWVVKINATGQIIRQLAMGGNSTETLYSAIPTPDNGWILTGYSFSPASGDKSENTLPGDIDGWVVKLNPEPALSVSERPVLAQVSCRPHPFSDAFSLSLERPAENDFTLRIFDLSGKCTSRFEWPAGNQTLDLSAQRWLPGNYIAEARSSNGALIFSTVLQKR